MNVHLLSPFMYIWAGGPVLAPMLKSRAQQISVNILGFVGPDVIVTATRVYCSSGKAAQTIGN